MADMDGVVAAARKILDEQTTDRPIYTQADMDQVLASVTRAVNDTREALMACAAIVHAAGGVVSVPASTIVNVGQWELTVTEDPVTGDHRFATQPRRAR